MTFLNNRRNYFWAFSSFLVMLAFMVVGCEKDKYALVHDKLEKLFDQLYSVEVGFVINKSSYKISQDSFLI